MFILKHLSRRFFNGPKENSVIQDLQSLFDVTYLRFMILISFFLRIFFFGFFHPNTPSSFAPDEGTYARLSEYVSKGFDVEEFPEYGPVLYRESRSLVLPSSVLIRIGFDAIESVRLVSTIYGFCLPVLTLLCFIALGYSINDFHSRTREKFSSRLAFFLIAILFFMPSSFLWSTLGLRESASNFWMLAQTYLLIKLLLGNNRKSIALMTLFILSSVMSFSSRPQTALVYSFTILIVTLCVAVKRRTFWTVCLLLISIFLGNSMINTQKVNTPVVGSATSVTSKVNTATAWIIPSHHAKLDSSLFEEKRNVNRTGASSALAPSNCSQSATAVLKLLCILGDIPYRLSAFLFRPFLILDSGSTLMILASIENLIWLLLFLITGALLFRRELLSNSAQHIWSIAFFLVLFSIAAALYEGNLGTAFRHKSTILSALIIILLILLFSKKRKLGVRRLKEYSQKKKPQND